MISLHYRVVLDNSVFFLNLVTVWLSVVSRHGNCVLCSQALWGISHLKRCVFCNAPSAVRLPCSMQNTVSPHRSRQRGLPSPPLGFPPRVAAHPSSDSELVSQNNHVPASFSTAVGRPLMLLLIGLARTVPKGGSWHICNTLIITQLQMFVLLCLSCFGWGSGADTHHTHTEVRLH